MYANGLTKYNTITAFQPKNFITREQAAKFLVMFAKNVMKKTPNTKKKTNFKDITDADPSLKQSIIESSQLSIFNGYND
jgi:hypothetical protein